MAEKQHRTNVTTTELTDKPQDQGSQGWAQRRGEEQDRSTKSKQQDSKQQQSEAQPQQ